jgi:hypothetical protein
MDNGQKTPRGYPDFNSYVKILRVFILQTDEQTDRDINPGGLHSLHSSRLLCICVFVSAQFHFLHVYKWALDVVHAYVGQKLLKPYFLRVFWLTNYGCISAPCCSNDAVMKSND